MDRKLGKTLLLSTWRLENSTDVEWKKGPKNTQEPGSVICVSYYKTAAAAITNTPPRTQLCCGFLTADLKTLTAWCLLDVSLSEPGTFRPPGSEAPPKEDNSFIVSCDIVLCIQNTGNQGDMEF